MFINLFKKVYLVDENNIPVKTPDISWRYLGNYREAKSEHATLLTFYRELMTNRLPDGRTDSNMILLIVKNEDVNPFMQDYCNYLGLDYEAYSLLIQHSKFCTTYVDNCNEIMSRDGDFPIIDHKDFIYRPAKIRRDFECFPAEYAINCMDQSWARKKYNYFRMYDIYNAIKNYQVRAYNEGLEMPELFKKFHTSDQSAKILGNIQVEEDVKREFIRLGLDTSLFTDVAKYMELNTNFGYAWHTIFKYNKPLVNYLKNVGYRIDEQMERESAV